MPEQAQDETFESFKKSFSYGSRNDLNFKFLKDMSGEDAASFIQELFWRLGDALGDGNIDPLIEHLVDGQARVYSRVVKPTYEDGPFTPLRKPLSELTLALLTSGGHFVEGDDPQPFGVRNMTQEEATARIIEFLKSEPVLSIIPADTQETDLRVRHPGYDIRGAQADPNVNFPLTRLRELQQDGVIGALAPQAYSFVGTSAQSFILNKAGPQWVEQIKGSGVDAVLLVPS